MITDEIHRPVYAFNVWKFHFVFTIPKLYWRTDGCDYKLPSYFWHKLMDTL